MDYKRLGLSGLNISALSLGTMTFGDGADEGSCQEMYTLSRDKGVNCFDCANVYAEGESERILGRLIKGHRDEVVISSKAYYPTGTDINARGLSRFHLTKALGSSLKNLKTDYLDVYYLHHFDNATPLEETLSTLNDFVRQGKVLYLGLSNFAAWQVMKAIAITKQLNYAPIACIQPMYNLLKRQCESEILPMALNEGLGVLPYGPVAGGYLSGKYLDRQGTDGRFDTSTVYRQRYEAETNLRTVETFSRFAKDNGYHPVSLAIAWVAAHPAVTSPLIGARTIKQLTPALAALDIPMTDELRNTLSGFSLSPAPADNRDEEASG